MSVVWLTTESLEKYVKYDANPGDVCVSYDAYYDYHYIFVCNKYNIGENANPYWTRFEHFEKELMINQFKNMSLEEKINLLIDDYIERKCKK